MVLLRKKEHIHINKGGKQNTLAGKDTDKLIISVET